MTLIHLTPEQVQFVAAAFVATHGEAAWLNALCVWTPDGLTVPDAALDDVTVIVDAMEN